MRGGCGCVRRGEHNHRQVSNGGTRHLVMELGGRATKRKKIEETAIQGPLEGSLTDRKMVLDYFSPLRGKRGKYSLIHESFLSASKGPFGSLLIECRLCI